MMATSDLCLGDPSSSAGRTTSKQAYASARCSSESEVSGTGAFAMTSILSNGKAKKPSSQSTPHDPQNCTEIAHRILGFTVALALDNPCSPCHNRNVKYVTENE